MRYRTIVAGLGVLVLVIGAESIAAGPAWTTGQEEVLSTVRAYTEASHQRDLDKYLSFWHPDFLGWHDGDSHPTSKEQRRKGLAYYFRITKSLEYELQPLAVLLIAEGQVAIVHYVLKNVLEETTKGEKSAGLSYWTDVLVKENGKWLLISDHGGNVEREDG